MKWNRSDEKKKLIYDGIYDKYKSVRDYWPINLIISIIPVHNIDK